MAVRNVVKSAKLLVVLTCIAFCLVLGLRFNFYVQWRGDDYYIEHILAEEGTSLAIESASPTATTNINIHRQSVNDVPDLHEELSFVSSLDTGRRNDDLEGNDKLLSSPQQTVFTASTLRRQSTHKHPARKIVTHNFMNGKLLTKASKPLPTVPVPKYRRQSLKTLRPVHADSGTNKAILFGDIPHEKDGGEQNGSSPSLRHTDRTYDYVDLHDFSKPTSLLRRCNTCAVVTNSGRLLNGTAGEKIDQFDCVLRMNVAPVRGYEEDVGRRTTVRVVSHSSLHFIFHSKYRNAKNNSILDHDDGLQLLVTFGPISKMCNGCWRIKSFRSWMQKYPLVKTVKLTQVAASRYAKDFIGEMQLNSSSKLWPSTGFYTLNFAMGMCNSISVFGLGRPGDDPCSDPHLRNIPYHYWERPNHKECKEVQNNAKLQSKRGGVGHSFQGEKEMFERWKRVYNIQFVYPS